MVRLASAELYFGKPNFSNGLVTGIVGAARLWVAGCRKDSFTALVLEQVTLECSVQELVGLIIPIRIAEHACVTRSIGGKPNFQTVICALSKGCVKRYSES